MYKEMTMLNHITFFLKVYALVQSKDYGTSHTIDDTASVVSPNCSVIQQPDDVLVNCISRSLTTVPELPKTSTSIRLDRNKIERITDLPFLGMTRLQLINISYNPLQYISKDLFKGLYNLQRIYMLNCLLNYQEDLDYGYLLSDVRILKEFSFTFQFFNRPCRYTFSTDSNLNTIKRATVLEISGAAMTCLVKTKSNFTVADTKKLILWNIGFKCLILNFHMEMFSTFAALEELVIYTQLHVFVYIEENAFSKLDNLILLKIRNPNIADEPSEIRGVIINRNWNMNSFVRNITTSVSKLDSLRELRMEGLNRGRKTLLLNAEVALPRLFYFKSLEILSLNMNFVFLHSFYDFSTGETVFPRSLITLELNGNCISHLKIYNLLELSYLTCTGLKHIYARFQNICGGSPMQYESYSKSVNKTTYRYEEPLIQSELEEVHYSHPERSTDVWFQHFPLFNKLIVLEYSWPKMQMGGSLKVPSRYFDSWPNLQYLDLSGSTITDISTKTFENITTLKALYLSYNSLGEMGTKLNSVLRQVRTLKELNLKNNGITSLNEDVFSSMNRLTTLDLSGNLLSKFIPSVSQLHKLKLLNISNNKLVQLSSKNRNDLEAITQKSAVVVDFTGNRFSCTCDTLAFLKWVISTHVALHRVDTFFCTTSNNKKIVMKNLRHEIATLESTCASNTVLIVVCSVATVLCISCLVAALMYKFRWRLRYMYYMAQLKVSQRQDKYDRIFDNDAFISYASDDFSVARTGCLENLENAKGLRLFIHERDFTPGEDIAYNISVGIHSSKLTIFFISEAFLSSEWCLYEFNIARMESLYAKRPTMLIVLLEKTVVSKLPLDIIDVIRSVTYLEYPEHGHEDDVMIFWNKLADCILR